MISLTNPSSRSSGVRFVSSTTVIPLSFSEKAEKVFADNADMIGTETLAVSVQKAEPAGYVKEWKINGENVTLGVAKM